MNYSVKVIKTERSHNPKIKGYATVILNNSFILKNIRVMQGREGSMYLAMPAWVNKTENHRTVFKDKFNPITKDFRSLMTDAAVKAYETGEVVTGQTGSGDDMPIEVSVKSSTRNKGNIKASANVVFDNSIVVKGIRYCVNDDQVSFLGYPSNVINRPSEEKHRFVAVCYPITKDFSNALYEAIADTYASMPEETRETPAEE